MVGDAETLDTGFDSTFDSAVLAWTGLSTEVVIEAGQRLAAARVYAVDGTMRSNFPPDAGRLTDSSIADWGFLSSVDSSGDDAFRLGGTTLRSGSKMAATGVGGVGLIAGAAAGDDEADADSAAISDDVNVDFAEEDKFSLELFAAATFPRTTVVPSCFPLGFLPFCWLFDCPFFFFFELDLLAWIGRLVSFSLGVSTSSDGSDATDLALDEGLFCESFRSDSFDAAEFSRRKYQVNARQAIASGTSHQMAVLADSAGGTALETAESIPVWAIIFVDLKGNSGM